MISIKVKLVAYFLVLSLLPVAAAWWGFKAAAQSTEARLVDERIQASLRAAHATLSTDIEAARRRALAVARDPSLQRALASGDRAALERLAGRGDVVIEAKGIRAGNAAPGAEARVQLTGQGGRIGSVIASVPFDERLADLLRTRSGLGGGDRIALVAGRRLVGVRGDARQLLGHGGFFTTALAGRSYRILMARNIAGSPDLALAVLVPKSTVDDAQALAQRELLIGMAASLLLIALVAYIEGASISRSLRRLVKGANAIALGRLDERVPVRTRDELGSLGRAFNEMAGELERERLRLRTVTYRFGEALAATHDVEQLLRVVVETAVEASRAQTGAVVEGGAELVRVGGAAGRDRFVVPLRARHADFGELMLTGESFSQDERDAAATLVTQAMIALENARLHRIVAQQARFDELTGLPNRRHCESALDDELSRARRSGEPFAFVLADLDDFKAINDRYGHPAGDRVLLAFGEALRSTLRQIDIAARWGGEEFALLMPATNLEEAASVVERVRAEVERRGVTLEDGTRLSLTASFGIAIYPDEGSHAKLVRAADAALYDAKRAGKNRVATNVAFAA